MAEKLVSDEMVFEIAEQLTAKGEKVTNRAVWSAIGGGSMTTISNALRRWRENQELQVNQSIERTPLPAAMVEVLHHAAAQLWDAAQTETKAELEQLAQATNARIAEAHSERDEALSELQATAEELDQTKAELGALQVVTDELRAQTVLVTEAIHRAETAEAVNVELNARVEQLSGFLVNEQNARKQAESELVKAQNEIAKLNGMIEVFNAIGGTATNAKTINEEKPKKPRGKAAKSSVDFEQI